MKRNIICIFVFFYVISSFLVSTDTYADNDNLELSAKSVVVMEGSTGGIIYEKDKDKRLNPASITKIMTLLIIYENLEKGKIKLTDEVSVSEHAASMGGSQVFLEPGEVQSVETLIKCITIASANDAAVAMAEHISGSEVEFVKVMNIRAKKLGMNNTCFKNCCGLDVEGHYSTAYDVGIMSKELICNYPQITKYTTTWMDSFVHKTRKGEKGFGLTNTNKLVRSYNGITGLKTGSTSLAKYCLSATARRNDIDIIAVVMGVPEHKLRYSEAAKLLDYGFAKTKLYEHKIDIDKLKDIKVKEGTTSSVDGYIKENYRYIQIENKENNIKYRVKIKDLKAPVYKNQKIGVVEYCKNGKIIKKQDILSKDSCSPNRYIDEIYKLWKSLICIMHKKG